MYLPSTRWTWSFFLVVLFQCLISLAIEGYVFGEFESSLRNAAKSDGSGNAQPDNVRTIPTYLALFIFGFIYECILTWDALRMKNTIQIIGLCLYNFGMLVYAAVEMNQVSDAIQILVAANAIDPNAWSNLRPYLVAAPCVIALGLVLMSFIAWRLHDEFAWTIYKSISADLKLKRRYLTYQIYIALLKFDFFFFLGFSVQFLVVVTNTYLSETILTALALPITIVLLFLAALSVRRESVPGQISIMVLYVAGMGYFVFKLVRMYDSPKAPNYYAARKSLTVFAVMAIICLCVTMGTAAICMQNFGKGLRPHLEGPARRGRESDEGNKYDSYGGESALNGQAHALGQVPSRMTID